MDGSSMPNAKNIADALKSVKVNTQTAADEVAKCFTSAIGYIFEVIKNEDFFKDFNKDIDTFCANTQQSITLLTTKLNKIFQDNIDKNFENTAIQIKTITNNVTIPIRTIIADIDGIQIPKFILFKLHHIRSVLKSYKKTLGVLKNVIKKVKKLGRFKIITNFLLKMVKSMTENISDIFKALKESSINAIYIVLLKKVLLKSVDIVGDFINLAKNKVKDITIKFVYHLILSKHALIKMLDIYDLIVDIAKKSFKIVLLGIWLNWGAKVISKFVKRLRDIIDTLNEVKISLKLRIKMILLKGIFNDILILGRKSIVFLIIGIPSILGILLMWAFVALARILVKSINKLSMNANTLKRLLALLAIMTLMTFIGTFAVIGGIMCAFGVFGLLAMWAFIEIFKLTLIDSLAKLKINKKALITLALLLLVAVMIGAIAFVLTLATLIGSKISLKGLGLIALSLLLLVGTVVGLGALMMTGFGMIAVLLGVAVIALVLLITFMLFKISQISEKIKIESLKNLGEALTITLQAIKIIIKTFKFNIKILLDVLKLVGLMALLVVVSFMVAVISKVSEHIKLEAIKNLGEALPIILKSIDIITKTYKISGKMLLDVLKLLVLMALLTVVSLMIVVLSKASEKISIKALGNIGEALGVILGALTLLGGLGTFITPILGAAVVAVGLIILATVPLIVLAKILSKVDDSIDYGKKIDTLISIVNTTVSKLTDIDYADILLATFKIRRLSTVSHYLANMAEEMASIAKLQIPIDWNEKGKPIAFRTLNENDFERVRLNVEKIITTILDAVTNDRISELSIFGVYRAMYMLHKLNIISLQLSFMAHVMANIARLSIADEWNDDGKPIHFRQLTETDFENANKSVEKIVLGLCTAVSQIATEDIALAADRAEDIFDDIEEIIDPIGRICDIITNLATMQIAEEWDDKGHPISFRQLENDDFTRATKGLQMIIEGFCGSIQNIGTEAIEKAADRAEDIFDDIEEIVDPIACIVDMTIKLAKGAQIPDQWDKDGKPIHYKTLIDSDYTSAADNIAGIVSSFMGMFSNPKLRVAIARKKTVEDSKSMFEALETAINPIKGVLDIVQGFAGGKFPTKFNAKGEGTDWVSISELCKPDGELSEKGLAVQNSITALITMTFDAIKNANLNDDDIQKNAALIRQLGTATKPINNMIKYYEKLDNNKVKNVNDFINDNIKWLDKVNAINVDKVKTTAAMFHEMSEFSKSISGDFDKLADTLNEKLMKILEELRDVLKDTGESVDKLAEGGRNTASGSSSPFSKESPVAEAPAKVDEDKNKKVDLTQTNTKIDRVVSEIGALTAELAKWRSSM